MEIFGNQNRAQERAAECGLPSLAQDLVGSGVAPSALHFLRAVRGMRQSLLLDQILLVKATSFWATQSTLSGRGKVLREVPTVLLSLGCNSDGLSVALIVLLIAHCLSLFSPCVCHVFSVPRGVGVGRQMEIPIQPTSSIPFVFPAASIPVKICVEAKNKVYKDLLQHFQT